MVVLQDLKGNEQGEPFTEREEIPGLKLNSCASCPRPTLPDEFGIQIETKAMKSSCNQVFIKPAAAHPNLQEFTSFGVFQKLIGQETAIKVGQSGVRKVRQFHKYTAMYKPQQISFSTL